MARKNILYFKTGIPICFKCSSYPSTFIICTCVIMFIGTFAYFNNVKLSFGTTHICVHKEIGMVSKQMQPPTQNPYDVKMGTFVIGILSNANNVCLREAQRKLFIPRARSYKRLDIKVFFLLDENTPALNLEQQINGDIVFLNTSVHGRGQGFARKLHIWLNYVIANFPETVLIGRMDDDAFTCTPQIFDRLNNVKHDLLYYGYSTGYPGTCTIDCVDEMFLIIGIELAKRVAHRSFCGDLKIRAKNCLTDGNGGHKFRRWIGIYKDYVFVDEKANHRMIWYYGKPKNLIDFKRFMTPLFCDNYLLYHKATPSEIYRWTQYNSLMLNDKSLINISEKDIMAADNCQRYTRPSPQNFRNTTRNPPGKHV